MTVGVSGSRVSNTLLTQLSIRNINQNMQRMLTLQHQLASGLRLYKTSVDPAGAAVSMAFQNIIERREQSAANISRSNEFLTSTDTALADLQDILNEASSIASENIGASTDDTARQNAATVVASLASQLAQLANRQYEGRYLFSGSASGRAPFDLSSTQVQFVGDLEALYANIDQSSSIQYNVTAEEVFGTLTGKVTSLGDLDPDITLATRLTELNAGEGVRRGTIVLNDGVTSTEVDLSLCGTVGEVVDAINNNGVVTVTAAINAAGNGLVIQADPGDTISVNESPGGYAARDLGILQTTPLGAGVDLVGQDLDRLMTRTTELSALRGGLGIDQVNGFLLTVGAETVTIDINAAVTVEDLLNSINFCGLAVVADIDTNGERIWIANAVASENMSIGENGGTTATDLGVRSMPASMLLANFNSGLGVRSVEGKTDFNIICSDGTTIDIDATGLSTVQDVLDAINTHANSPGNLTASLNPVGNGIRLDDLTGGAGDFQVVATNNSHAAADLGIEQTIANPGAVIAGEDVAPVVEEGIFRYVFDLREALLSNDSAAISRAGAAIQGEISRVGRVRGTVGARMQTLDRTMTRIEDEVVQVKGLLSEVRDLDYTSAVAQFETLTTVLQASLETAANVLPMTLMDFLTL